MGKIDIETKKYLRDNTHFADAFNFLLYDGQPVIAPENLKPLDTTEIVIPYGNEAREPSQKIRDELKLWLAMEDSEAIYVVLGEENQTNIHYAMPVKDMVLDAMNYSRQVEEARKSYNRFHQKSEGGARLTGDEFLSGFRKEDRLMPVITLVIYWGDSEWDGPMSIHEMLSTTNETLLSFVQDYRIHLIAPSHIADSDFTKFDTGLGRVLFFIKHSADKEKLDHIVKKEKRFRELDYESARLINVLTGAGLSLKKKEDNTVDMCEAIEAMRRESRDEGKAEGRVEGREETLLETARNVMSSLCITAKEAMNIMMIPAEIQEKLSAKL